MEDQVTLQTLSEKIDNLTRVSLIGVKDVLDFEETCLYTGFSRGHLYRLTSGRQIPFSRKNRKLYFKKSELERWMLAERVKTVKEIDSEATTYTAITKKNIDR